MSDSVIRIGTRESQLAVWQAQKVAELLRSHGFSSRLVYIKTEGDKVLDTPLPLMGGKGVFTKALDDALYAHEIDIAVHSYKDVPTEQPPGLMTAAVCEREDYRDVFVFRDGVAPAVLENPDAKLSIATSSNRRMALWRNRYPNTTVFDIRGNVQTRLKKLDESDWHGVIFAAAGLKRLDLEHRIGVYLDWMLPAPAQGALCIMCREEDHVIRTSLSLIHDPVIAAATGAERDFLHELEGGCSAPIGAIAQQHGEQHITLEAAILNLDGSNLIHIRKQAALPDAHTLGKSSADEARKLGADTIIRALKKNHK